MSAASLHKMTTQSRKQTLTRVGSKALLVHVSYRSCQAWVEQGISAGQFRTSSTNPTVVGGGKFGAAT